MKCLITGGAGFIGSHIVDELVLRGYEVHVLDNLSSGKEENLNPKAVFHKADIRHLEEILPIFSGVDFVFHLAAIPEVQYSIENPAETNEVNIGGTQNVLIASEKAGVKKVIYSSSCAVYGEQEKLPMSETDLPRPKSPYGLQKYVGEHFCRIWSEIYGLPTVSLRYFNVYGPRQKSTGAYASVIMRFLKQKKEGGKMAITGDGLQTRDFTHVKDVVSANIKALENQKVGNGEVINIGTGIQKSVLEVAKLIGGDYEFLPPRVELLHARADITKAKELLDWVPQADFDQEIERLKNL